ncbi:MAG: hypothetical protein Q9181_001634 [Wetmoreana brouardii]
MQNRPFSPTNPQQRTGGVLPPLSKYYYGPAVSPDRSPVNGNSWSTPDPPALPPRLPPSAASAPPISQWSPQYNGPAQHIKLPGPPPTAPPAHPVVQSSYNPNTYGPMPGARHSPLNTSWNQSSHSVAQVDTSTWGVNYHHNNAQQSQSGLKPPLPPRAPPSQSQLYVPADEHKAQLAQENESFEYLRPIAYSPASSPSIPQNSSASTSDHSGNSSTQPEPQRLPPPPPPKIPTHGKSQQGQDPEARYILPYDHDGSSHEQFHRVGSEVHVIDYGVDQQRPSSEAQGTGKLKSRDGDANFSRHENIGDIESDNHQTSEHPPRESDTASGVLPSVTVDAQHGEPASRSSYDANDRFILSALPRLIPSHTFQESEMEQISQGTASKHEELLASSDPVEGAQKPTEASVGQKSKDASEESQNTYDNRDQDQRNDSFYWHSPQSSTCTSHDRDQNQDIPGTSSLLDATPEPQEQHPYVPPRDQENTVAAEHTNNLYQPILGTYSASALGFGGPSDWEHFGDYDGEEIDDTDLYIRSDSPKNKKAPTSTSELPADSPPVITHSEQPPTVFEEPSKASNKVEQENFLSTSPSKTQTSYDRSVDIGYRLPEQNGDDATQFKPSDQSTFQTSPQEREPFFGQQRAPQSIDVASDQERSDPPSTLLKDSYYRPGEGVVIPPTATDTGCRSPEGTSLPEDRSLAAESNVEPSIPVATSDNTSLTDVIVESNTQNEDDTEQRPSGPAHVEPRYHDQPRSGEEEAISDTHAFTREDSIKRSSLVSDGSLLSKAREMTDPYADLDPWAKASLNRYIAMLREEARAPNDSEKLDLFKAFSRKEWRLRVVLYGADDEQGDTFPLTSNDGPGQSFNTLGLRRPPSKALPALPLEAEHSKPDVPINSSLTSANVRKPSLEKLLTGKEDVKTPRSSGEGSYVMVDTPGGRRQHIPDEGTAESYSPGGRPIQIQAIGPRNNVARSVPAPGSSKADVPDTVVPQEQASDSKPAYTPFRYSQGYLDDAEQPVDRRASYRPYAALKLEPVADRADSAPERVTESPQRTNLPSSSSEPQLMDSAPSNDQGLSDLKPQQSIATENGQPLDLRRFERADFDPLIAVLPASGHIPQSAVELSSFQRGINAIPDDFGFIHQHVVAWDAKAKQMRAQHEKEGQIRQGESEQRIDALFNDDEIGYGDISELESDFKRAEAARKNDEDRAEYQTFVTEVFDAVWYRLHLEIDQLSPLYDEYTGLAHETLAGKDMFEATENQYALAPTMSALLALHQKLEIRHKKASEAVLERDRRLRKTEVSRWYTLGNVAKVKQLEKQFEHAERKGIVEYSKQRDRRANQLMDVLDQNTLRGVGANQDYMEAVMKAVRRIASGRAFASAPASEPGLGMDEVMKAKAVTAVLASSSEQIVQTFHVADMLLNAADYELSVATARLANADSTMFERLKEERASEDAKLMRDLQHRLALIREDSRRTNDEIVKLLCFLGVQGGHAQVPNLPAISDPEHKQRLQKALEDAKRRNAAKAAGSDAP